MTIKCHLYGSMYFFFFFKLESPHPKVTLLLNCCPGKFLLHLPRRGVAIAWLAALTVANTKTTHFLSPSSSHYCCWVFLWNFQSFSSIAIRHSIIREIKKTHGNTNWRTSLNPKNKYFLRKASMFKQRECLRHLANQLGKPCVRCKLMLNIWWQRARKMTSSFIWELELRVITCLRHSLRM